MSTFVERVLGAARLDAAIFEEVEHDPGAWRQSLGVVALYGVAAGVGELGGVSLVGLVSSILGAMLAWLIWASLTFVIGTRLLPQPATQADLGQLLRTLGFAAGPGILLVLEIVHPLRSLVFVIVQLWMIATMVVAVRQALDYTSTLRAVAVCSIGWICQLLIAILLFSALAQKPASIPADAPPHERLGAGSVGVVRPSAVAPPVR